MEGKDDKGRLPKKYIQGEEIYRTRGRESFKMCIEEVEESALKKKK